MRTSLLVVAVASLMSLGGCSDQTDAQTELTRAQKDSIVADLPVRGASGVGAALEARDRASARAARLDSMRD